MNKLNLKKILYFLLLIFLVLLSYFIFIQINLKNNNQSSEYIINGYKLLTVSAYNKCIGYELDNGTTKIGTYVAGHVYKYCFNFRYIGIQQVKPAKTKEELDYTSINYFMIDTEIDDIYFFKSKTEYDDFIIKNKIGDLSNWIETLK